MRVEARIAFAVLSMSLATIAANGAAAQEQTPPPQFRTPAQVNLCADFSLFADATPFPMDFTLAAFKFHDASGAPTLTAATGGNEVALGFGADGIGITLPFAVEAATLRVGAFAGPVSVIGYDENFAVQFQTTVAENDAFNDVALNGQGILYVSVGGDGSAGLLSNICIDTTMLQGGFAGGQGRFGAGQFAPGGNGAAGPGAAAGP